jgi:hypothetical protein
LYKPFTHAQPEPAAPGDVGTGMLERRVEVWNNRIAMRSDADPRARMQSWRFDATACARDQGAHIGLIREGAL